MIQRRTIRIDGIVQGVGFRPFVYGLAKRLDLAGSVRNESGQVWIDVEGETERLDALLVALREEAPPLARLNRIDWHAEPLSGCTGFEIVASRAGETPSVLICADIATCDDCLRELFDRNDRRYLYPFTNCTNCGPRLTIIRAAPYDRHNTTMASFPLCDDCRREYDDPLDRRFHAQPVACAKCGPQLELLNTAGQRVAGDDPIAETVKLLKSGKIVAIKGLGGYHLACDAGNPSAVQELRRRKHRDEKPLAIMVRTVEDAQRLATIDDAERALLTSPRRPIVLLQRRSPQTMSRPQPLHPERYSAKNLTSSRSPDHSRSTAQDDDDGLDVAQAPPIGIAAAVAPGNPRLGLMLPYTPVHHLLLAALDGRPLVMTSGNRSEEPIAYEDPDAIDRLAGIADAFLAHNRPIHVRCDDSVTRVIDGVEAPIRRSRGDAPQPIALPVECHQPLLAVGGQMKATFALGRGNSAIVSHHLGDLDHFEAFRAFEKDVALYEQLFAIAPQVIVHDLHPDYASTRYALDRRKRTGVRCVAVQHHHAHMASCMAEHGLTEPVIGVSFDGTGYGTDGAIWGGEFLVGDYRGFQRAAHLRYVPMPGGEACVHEPWRMAMAHLRDAGLDLPALQDRIDPIAWRTAGTMLARHFNCPKTSSAGRLFDAVASLVGIRDVVGFEAQAAIELEWAAAESRAGGTYPFAMEQINSSEGAKTILDTRPLVAAIVADVADGVISGDIARKFHTAIANLILAMCTKIRAEQTVNTVTLSGGVFMNALLSSQASRRLTEAGFDVYRHERLPCGDGGISLGQLIIGNFLAAKA